MVRFAPKAEVSEVFYSGRLSRLANVRDYPKAAINPLALHKARLTPLKS